MATQEEGTGLSAYAGAGPRRSWSPWKTITGFLVNKPLGAAGAAIIIVMSIMAIAGDWISFYDPVEWNLRDKLISHTPCYLLERQIALPPVNRPHDPVFISYEHMVSMDRGPPPDR